MVLLSAETKRMVVMRRCFCRVFVPPGRGPCCQAHTSRYDDEETTPVAPVPYRALVGSTVEAAADGRHS